ncbi:MAG: glycosyltransferase [Candidatus Bathyarchaeia archaeon]
MYMAPCGIGLGHVTRCEPIAKALKQKGINIVFSTCFEAADYLMKMGYKVFKITQMSYAVNNDGTVDYKMSLAYQPGFFRAIKLSLKELIFEFKRIKSVNPQLVFSDSRLAPILIAKTLGIPTILMLNQFKININNSNFDNSLIEKASFSFMNILWGISNSVIEGIWSLSDQILIPDFPPPYTISFKNLIIPKAFKGKVNFIGPIIPIMYNDLPEEETIKKELKLDNSKIIVYAPISGPKKEKNYLLKKLMKIFQSFPDKYEVIISKGNPEGDCNLKRINKVKVYEWVNEETQFKLFKVADVIIGRAGHGVIMKSLAYKKPIIAIPVPGQAEQYGNAERIEQLKLGKMINQEHLNKETLLTAIENLINFKNENLEELFKILNSFNGIKSTLNLILKILNCQ